MASVDPSVISQEMSKLEAEIQYRDRRKSKHRGPQKCVRRSTQVVQRLLNPETHRIEENMSVMW